MSFYPSVSPDHFNIRDAYVIYTSEQEVPDYLMFSLLLQNLYVFDETFFFRVFLPIHSAGGPPEATGLTLQDEHLAGARLTECLVTQDRR